MPRFTTCVFSCEKFDVLHRFPKDPKNFQEWKDALGTAWNWEGKTDIDIYTNCRVCNRHFEERFVYPGSKRLAKGSLPTLYLSETTNVFEASTSDVLNEENISLHKSLNPIQDPNSTQNVLKDVPRIFSKSDFEHNYTIETIFAQPVLSKVSKVSQQNKCGLKRVENIIYSVDSNTPAAVRIENVTQSQPDGSEPANNVVIEPLDGQDFTEFESLDEIDIAPSESDADETAFGELNNDFEEIAPNSVSNLTDNVEKSASINLPIQECKDKFMNTRINDPTLGDVFGKLNLVNSVSENSEQFWEKVADKTVLQDYLKDGDTHNDEEFDNYFEQILPESLKSKIDEMFYSKKTSSPIKRKVIFKPTQKIKLCQKIYPKPQSNQKVNVILVKGKNASSSKLIQIKPGKQFMRIQKKVVEKNTTLPTPLNSAAYTADDNNENINDYLKGILTKSPKSNQDEDVEPVSFIKRKAVFQPINKPSNEIRSYQMCQNSSLTNQRVSKGRLEKLNTFVDKIIEDGNKDINPPPQTFQSQTVGIPITNKYKPGLQTASMKDLLMMRNEVKRDLDTIEQKIEDLDRITFLASRKLECEPKDFVCRICLIKGPDIQMYDMKENPVLARAFRRLVGAQIKPFMPHYFCWYCSSLLMKYSKFRKKCLKAQEHYKDVHKAGYTKSSLRNLNLGDCLKTMRSSARLGAFSCIGQDPPETGNPIAADYIQEFQTSLTAGEAEDSVRNLMKSEDITETSHTSLIPLSNKETKNTYVCFIDRPKKSGSKRKLKNVKTEMNTLDSSKWSVHEKNVSEVFRDIETAKEYFKRTLYKCMLCHLAYSNEKKFNDHYALSHNPDHQFVCKFCQKRFSTIRQLKIHIDGHIRVYKCKLCSFTTNKKSKTVAHDRVHEGVTFSCEECGSQHSSLLMLKAHVRRRHFHEMPCPRCGRAFPYVANLKRHMKHHCEPPSENIESSMGNVSLHCIQCDVTFETAAALANHLTTTKRHQPNGEVSRKHRLKEKKVPKCLKCKIRFDTKEELEEHKTEYHKRYTFATLRKSGIRIPTLKVSCHICGAFLSCGSMRLHMLRHVNVKPYRCEECGHDFRNQSNLIRHRLVHTGLKPYTCDICDKTFTQSNSLKLHISTVHLKQPHPKRKPRKKVVQQEVFGPDDIQIAASQEVWTEGDEEKKPEIDSYAELILLQDEGNQAVVVQKMEGNWQERDPWGEIANERPKKGFKRPRYAD